MALERRALVALYAKRSGRAEMPKVLPYAAVQRLVQCLGAYGRLASVGQPQFGKFVLPALENLLDAADRAGLDAVGALAEDLIAAEQRRSEHGKACSCGHSHADGGSCTCGHSHAPGEPCACGHGHADGEPCSCGHGHADGGSCSCGHGHHHGSPVPCGRGHASAPSA